MPLQVQNTYFRLSKKTKIAILSSHFNEYCSFIQISYPANELNILWFYVSQTSWSRKISNYKTGKEVFHLKKLFKIFLFQIFMNFIFDTLSIRDKTCWCDLGWWSLLLFLFQIIKWNPGKRFNGPPRFFSIKVKFKGVFK